MKAITCRKSGTADVLRLEEIGKPVPQDNEMIVKVKAATVTIGDVLLRKMPRIVLIPLGMMFGFKVKTVPGTEFAGVVESTGKDVKLFKAGDEVFGTTTGLRTGGNSQYICIPERWKQGVVAVKPGAVPFEEAAALPVGGMTAMYLLNKVNIRKGCKVLVYGASGSVGTYAVQLAVYFGADVTGVCSTDNMDMVGSLGAARVIDYTKEDFRKNGESYDVIFDAVGKIRRSACEKSLAKDGSYVSVRKPTKEKTDYLVFLGNLAAEGKIRAVIDRRYPLEQVPEAHRYVEKRHKRGNVVITFDQTD